MKSHTLLIVVLTVLALTSCGGHELSPEELAQVEELKAEFNSVQSEIDDAEQQHAAFSGGLIKSLTSVRIEILKINEALIQQRIHALESRAEISIEISGFEPDLDEASRIEGEIRDQQVKIQAARAEADNYSGGLLRAVALTTVATEENTLAMLRQRYLLAKYGLYLPSLPEPPAGVQAGTPITIDTGTGEALGERKDEDLANQIILVRLLKKEFSEQDYEEYIFFDIELTAQGLDKPARAIKGALNLQDLFGETKLRVGWTIDDPIPPGGKHTERGTGFEYNKFKDSHKWVRSTDLKDMTASFTVTSILYEDGSRRDLE